jgi:Relaxase/Mobilisation nuclease domain
LVPKLLSAGKSFKGLARYLTTDPKASTAERVAWTHTLNLACDTVPEAVNEMLWTYRAADELKRQAGISTTGRRLENPVKHFSLNWHRSEDPEPAHMIETVRGFLEHMGWGERQAVLVGHNDRHPHVHVMLNSVHPETGRALDTAFEKRRAQAWALDYEREQSRIFCEQRLLPEEQREQSPTRQSWLKLKETEQLHDKAECARIAEPLDYFARGDRPRFEAHEWEALKSCQRDERLAFFVEGKQAFKSVRNAIFREVRAEFREEWKGYYDTRRSGGDADRLAEMKADILARQNAELDTRRTTACAELRERRDGDYDQLLLEQKRQRDELAARQEQGERSPQLLAMAYPGATPEDPADAEYGLGHDRNTLPGKFRHAADETCRPDPEHSATREREAFEPFEATADETFRVRNSLDVVGGVGLGILGGLATIGERLFDGMLGGAARAPRPPAPETPRRAEQSQTRARAVEGLAKKEESQADEAARLETYWGERSRRRGRDRD